MNSLCSNSPWLKVRFTGKKQTPKTECTYRERGRETGTGRKEEKEPTKSRNHARSHHLMRCSWNMSTITIVRTTIPCMHPHTVHTTSGSGNIFPGKWSFRFSQVETTVQYSTSARRSEYMYHWPSPWAVTMMLLLIIRPDFYFLCLMRQRAFLFNFATICLNTQNTLTAYAYLKDNVNDAAFHTDPSRIRLTEGASSSVHTYWPGCTAATLCYQCRSQMLTLSGLQSGALQHAVSSPRVRHAESNVGVSDG